MDNNYNITILVRNIHGVYPLANLHIIFLSLAVYQDLHFFENLILVQEIEMAMVR